MQSSDKQMWSFWPFWAQCQKRHLVRYSASLYCKCASIQMTWSLLRALSHAAYVLFCMVICERALVTSSGRFTVSAMWTRWASLDTFLQLWWRRHIRLCKTQFRFPQLWVNLSLSEDNVFIFFLKWLPTFISFYLFRRWTSTVNKTWQTKGSSFFSSLAFSNSGK